MSTNPPDPASGAPAETDPSGQTAPAPDSVGVPEGQGAMEFREISSSDQGTADEATLADEPAADEPQPAVAATTALTTSPPPPDRLAELPAWAENETADPAVIRRIQQGTSDRPDEEPPQPSSLEGSEAHVEGDYTYVSPSDPKFGASVSRWLEGVVARDARLGPLLERLVLLENVYIRFDSDSPVLAVDEPVEEEEADQPAEEPVTA